jgi:hypothetical protein
MMIMWLRVTQQVIILVHDWIRGGGPWWPTFK